MNLRICSCSCVGPADAEVLDSGGMSVAMSVDGKGAGASPSSLEVMKADCDARVSVLAAAAKDVRECRQRLCANSDAAVSCARSRVAFVCAFVFDVCILRVCVHFAPCSRVFVRSLTLGVSACVFEQFVCPHQAVYSDSLSDHDTLERLCMLSLAGVCSVDLNSSDEVSAGCFGC